MANRKMTATVTAPSCKCKWHFNSAGDWVKGYKKCGKPVDFHFDPSGVKVWHKTCLECRTQQRKHFGGLKTKAAPVKVKAKAAPVKAKVAPVKRSNGYMEHMSNLFAASKETADKKREGHYSTYDRAMQAGLKAEAEGYGGKLLISQGYDKHQEGDPIWGVCKTSKGNDGMAWHLRNRVNNGTIIWEKTRYGLTRKIRTTKSNRTGWNIAQAIAKELGETFEVHAF